jgi:hypothetical protein
MLCRLAPALLVAGLLLTLVPAAHAQTQTRFGIHGFFGYQGHAMDDINTLIVDPVNELFYNAAPQSGAPRMDDLSGHTSFGGGVTADVGRKFRVAADYERLGGSTNISGGPGYFKISVPADVFLLTGTYFFPSASKVRLGLGAGLGYYSSAATAEGNITIGTDTFAGTSDIGGSGVGYHFQGDLDYAAGSKINLQASLGYRIAKFDADIDGDPLGGQLDWSGVLTRAGLTYFFN